MNTKQHKQAQQYKTKWLVEQEISKRAVGVKFTAVEISEAIGVSHQLVLYYLLGMSRGKRGRLAQTRNGRNRFFHNRE